MEAQILPGVLFHNLALNDGNLSRQEMYTQIADILVKSCFSNVSCHQSLLVEKMPLLDADLRSDTPKSLKTAEHVGNYGKQGRESEVRLLYESGLITLQYINTWQQELLPPSCALYKNYAEFISIYKNVNAVFTLQMDEHEQNKLVLFANFIKVMILFFTNKNNKLKYCIDLVTRICEGKNKKYSKGGGQSVSTERREWIFRQEACVPKAKRPMRWLEIVEVINGDTMPVGQSWQGRFAEAVKSGRSDADTIVTNSVLIQHPIESDINLRSVEISTNCGKSVARAVSISRKHSRSNASSAVDRLAPAMTSSSNTCPTSHLNNNSMFLDENEHEIMRSVCVHSSDNNNNSSSALADSVVDLTQAAIRKCNTCEWFKELDSSGSSIEDLDYLGMFESLVRDVDNSDVAKSMNADMVIASRRMTTNQQDKDFLDLEMSSTPSPPAGGARCAAVTQPLENTTDDYLPPPHSRSVQNLSCSLFDLTDFQSNSFGSLPSIRDMMCSTTSLTDEVIRGIVGGDNTANNKNKRQRMEGGGKAAAASGDDVLGDAAGGDNEGDNEDEDDDDDDERFDNRAPRLEWASLVLATDGNLLGLGP